MVECIPILAILGLIGTAFGYFLISENAEDMVDGLANFGLETKNLKDFIMFSSSIILAVNALVLAFSLFSTGCCRRRCFHSNGKKACCTWTMGPIAQGAFFCVTTCAFVLAFVVLLACLVCVVVALFTEAVCESPLDYPCPAAIPASQCMQKINGQVLMGQMVQSVDLPDILTHNDKNATVDGATLCHENPSFKDGSGRSFVGFTMIMISEVLILVKVVHTFTSICWEMSAEKEVLPMKHHAPPVGNRERPMHRI